MRVLQQLRHSRTRETRQHTLEQFFSGAPDALISQGHGQGAACGHGIFHALQGANFFGQGVVHQHSGLTFSLQALQHAQHPRHLARQHRLRQFEDVVTGHIEYGTFHLRQAQFACGVEQPQLLDFLVGRQQVAFHPICKKIQTGQALWACRHSLVLLLQALRNPLRQLRSVDGLNLQGHAVLL